MNITEILAELRRERDRLDEAILSIERLIYRGQRKRGRPPKLLAQARDEAAKGSAAGQKPARRQS